MEEPRIETSSRGHVHISHVGWMYMALVLISFAAVVGTGLGVYYLQQGQIDSLTESLNNRHAAATGTAKSVTPTVQGKTFESEAPFTFDYPSDWTVNVDKPLQDASKIPGYTTYGIRMLVPGTIEQTRLDQSQVVSRGAIFTVFAGNKFSFASIDEITKQSGFTARHQNITKTTLGSVPALNYTENVQGQETITTLAIRDGWQYKVLLTVQGPAKDSPYVGAYQALVKSFAFK